MSQSLTNLTDKDLILTLSNNVANNSTYYIAPGTILPYTDYTNYPYTWITYNSPPVNTAYVAIDKAENGFIITKNNKKYVAKKAEEVVKYLKEEEK